MFRPTYHLIYKINNINTHFGSWIKVKTEKIFINVMARNGTKLELCLNKYEPNLKSLVLFKIWTSKILIMDFC